MEPGAIIAIAIGVLVVLGGVLVAGAMRRRDTAVATGELSRETRRRDRGGKGAKSGAKEVAPLTGREFERAATLERVGTLPAVRTERVPAPYVPPDPEAIGVTRRQFLNRGIVNMMGISIGAFGAASIAFLWPPESGGFGSKITLPDALDDILAQIAATKQPYYFAPGRVYIQPYPKAALAKAKNVYTGGVLEGMEQGVVAIYQKCVHLGCRVPWCQTSQWFECPCHGSQYNRVGEKKGGPAPRGLDRFPVSVEGNRISVDTGLVVLGPVIGTNTTGQEAEGPNCVG
jgi:cytochrome b6-f complex iron-sulfur subunit